MAERTVLLMGLRGSGKSTIGREFAAASGRTFIDLDELTLVRLGTESVAEAWARFGESAFRAAERDELDRVLRSRPSGRAVVALGGGTPTAPGADDLIRGAVASGRVSALYLRAQPDTLRARLAGSDHSDRPSLTGAGTLAEVEQVFNARDGLYREIASSVIETDDLDEAGVVAAIEAAVGA
ncbi:MAG: shikimate kinase [Planctomycetes bacterium]|nr:shikimate kinase [Planctomycetota bacterium]